MITNLLTTRIFLVIVVLSSLQVTVYGQGIFDQTADWELSRENNTKVPGSAQFEDGVYTIQGNGDDIFLEEDEGFYLYTNHEGDTTLQGRVVWIDPTTNDWSKAGLMIRENGQSNSSKNYSFLLRGSQFGDRSAITWRAENGGSSSLNFAQDSEGNDHIGDSTGEGVWMRLSYLESQGLVVASYSPDGNEWEEIHRMEMTMEPPVAYGLVITSHMDFENLAEAEFYDVELRSAETPFDTPTPEPVDTATPTPTATSTPFIPPSPTYTPTPESPVATPTPISGWFVLDGFGGIHKTNPDSQRPVLPYFSFNIVRDLEPDPLGRGWYMLDGFGGIHTSSPDLPKPEGLPYFSFDIARNLEIKESDDGLLFYLLDGYGTIHTTDENFSYQQLPWFGFDNVRDLEPDGERGWYVLDQFGVIHDISGEFNKPLGVSFVSPIVKSIIQFDDESMVMLDGYGGRFTNPSNPARNVLDGLPNSFYFPGFDIIWDMEVVPE